MEFESAKEAAERLGVTIRAIQKWAKQGRLPGAYLVGRMWNIPKDITEPLKLSDVEKQNTTAAKRLPLPLLRSNYKIGNVKEFIDSITDPDDRNIALAEYYYYTGNAVKAAELAERYIDSEDSSLRYSASVLCTFANIFRGHIHLATFVSELVSKELEEGLKTNSTKEFFAFGVLTANIGNVILGISVPETPPLEEYLHYLPQGIRLFGCYILAYKAYKEQNYERAIAICDTALAVCGEFYPIASIYILIVAASSCMAQKKTDLAKKHFTVAWDIAKADGLVKLFGIHHNLLQGLNEQHLKKEYPNEYRQIVRIIKEFNDGWYRLHKPSDDDLTHTLDPIEISIALLYNRDYAAKEIAVHLNLSERTVKNHIRDIYDKLCITKKTELQDYLKN